MPINNKRPVLTIGIPTRNRADYLKILLDSLCGQCDSRVEIVISDNASTDNTEAVVKEFQNKFHFIRYYRNEINIGPFGNFRKAYSLAEGQFTLLAGDDDEFIANSLHPLLQFLEENSDISIGFLNYIFKKEVNPKEYKLSNSMITCKENILTTNKDTFVKWSGLHMTYMGSIIFSTDKLQRLKNPEIYDKTSFAQTCWAFMCASESNSLLAVYSEPVMKCFLPIKGGYNPFSIFGQNLKTAYCDTGAKCGFNRKTLEKMYKKYAVITYIKMIAGCKIKGLPNLKESFWNNVYPALKSYPSTYLVIIPELYLPVGVLSRVRNVARKVIYK